jgi:hypothetical protein
MNTIGSYGLYVILGYLCLILFVGLYYRIFVILSLDTHSEYATHNSLYNLNNIVPAVSVVLLLQPISPILQSDRVRWIRARNIIFILK